MFLAYFPIFFLFRVPLVKYAFAPNTQACRSRGYGGAMVPPDFDISEDLGGQIMPTTLLLHPPPRIFRPSYGPAIYIALVTRRIR